MAESETIYALSTPQGRSAIAVIRLTGSGSASALRSLTGAVPPPRHARLAFLRDPRSGTPLDRALVLFFSAPRSFTGEDMAEIHCHGGTAVVSAMLGAIGSIPGLRAAEPGEFTRRAFEAGRLDLTEVEGLADLLLAETEAQRRQAFCQMEGGLAEIVESWRARLIRLMALAEAEMDFPDEDLPPHLLDNARAEINDLKEDFELALSQGTRGERLREGFQVALVGPPNAGKSTLLNALARRDVAIVSDEPGTTRDVLEVHLDLGGWPVTVADMAGLRQARGGIEALGIARARTRAEAADLRLVVLPLDLPQDSSEFRDSLAFLGPSDLLLRSKCDLVPFADSERALAVSAITGAGVGALLDILESRAAERLAPSEGAVITRARHRDCLTDARDALSRALGEWTMGAELRAEELRLAARALGRIAGRVDVEDVLDVVFATFCIGK